MLDHDETDLADLSRVFPESPGVQLAPADRRLRELRDVDTPYRMPVYESLTAWEARAAWLRGHILVCAGLWPAPERTPLNPVVFGRIERDGYSVEKARFESYPGFFVTGNLYRPLGPRGPFPGVLHPHGHSRPRGRLTHSELFSYPARAITFARQGYVAFSYDMVGFVDSRQVPHTFGGPREYLWGISLLGLQLWNSLRAVDFLAGLPDVDPERLGCTGESGGGTQTFLLAAVEDRIKVAAPVNMVSAHMQGGCLCENAPGLRVETNNVEIAALMAPRPLLLVAATGDWTRNTPTVEYPAVRSIYQLYGAAERVAWFQDDAPHNYNLRSREAVYAFFGRWLLGAPAGADPREQPFGVEQDSDLRVFPESASPPGELGAEKLVRYLVGQAAAAVESRWPRTAAELDGFRAAHRPALEHILAAEWPREVTGTPLGSAELGDFAIERLLLGRPELGDQIPALLLRPPGWSGGPAAVVVDAGGKSAQFDGDGRRPGELLRGLLESGRAVLAADLFLTGEYHTRNGCSGRDQSVAHFATYNRTDTALRAQDILNALTYLRGRCAGATVDLIGFGDAGLWCLLARCLAPRPPRVVADAARFADREDADYLARLFVPGLRRAGGVRTALALAAPAPTLLHRTGGVLETDLLARLYRALGQPEALVVRSEEAGTAEILGWLTSG